MVRPGWTPRQLHRLDAARALRALRAIRCELSNRGNRAGGPLNLPAWELARFREQERTANREATWHLAQLAKLA